MHEEKNGPPPPIACVARIAREAVTRGIPVAVATSGVQASVERHLAHCGLDEIFNSEKRNVVFTKDVAAGKPAPDIYIEGARRIGVDPRFCRAFEDGESGAQLIFRLHLVGGLRSACLVWLFALTHPLS